MLGVGGPDRARETVRGVVGEPDGLVLAVAGTRRDRARGMLDVLAGGVVDDPRKGRIKLVESLAGGPLTAAERRRGLRHLASLVESLLREDWNAPAPT